MTAVATAPTEPVCYKVKAPDPRKETVVNFNEHVADVIEELFFTRPSRQALRNYRLRGFPIKRGQIYLEMPVFQALNRPMTTIEAMDRWRDTFERLSGSA